jgi:cytoplasmic polyadenylation element-binding protein
LSPKFFVGGIPPNTPEYVLVQTFKPFGNIRIEWPAKDNAGYLYVIFEHEKQLRSLLENCTISGRTYSNMGT